MKASENQSSETISTAKLQAEIERLNSLLRVQTSLNQKQNSQLQKNEKLIAQKDEKIQNLTDQLAYLRRAMFGRSSERFLKSDPDQLKLDFDGLEVLPEEIAAAAEGEIQTVTYQRKKQKEDNAIPVRKALPAHLEREDEIIEPENIPDGSKLIGEEISERLAFKPAKLYVIRTIRRKYALPQQQGVIIGSTPNVPLPKSNADASLLAHLLISKYLDHLPFYRQIEIFKRNDVHLAASTINGWFSWGVDLLGMLYQELRRQVLEADYIQMDETIIPVLDKDKPGAARKGYHWISRSPEKKMLFFHYDKGSRAHRVAVDVLRDFKGAVQSDGYGAYSIYENKAGVILLGCWSHARRKFEQALENDPGKARYALEQIQLLYLIEREIENENLNAEMTSERRKQKAYPILLEFEKWLDRNYSQVLPKSRIGQAIKYTYSIYPRLARYVIDGRYLPDNNGAENGVRPLALGRKNYMFAGNHQAAERAAIIYSLLGTCKINNVNPQEWLTDIFNRINDTKNTELFKLLPAEWAKARDAAKKEE